MYQAPYSASIAEFENQYAARRVCRHVFSGPPWSHEPPLRVIPTKVGIQNLTLRKGSVGHAQNVGPTGRV